MSADGPDLYDLLDGLMDLHRYQRAGRWREVSDEGLDGFVEQVVDVLLPKATRVLRGDGWVLTREADDEC